MNNSVVCVKNLSHKYSVQWAIRDINFELAEKGVTGLLGSNGAGKSTTMNIICGALKPCSGEVFINGIDISSDPLTAKKSIGYLPQTPPIYKDLTVKEYLTHCALLRFVQKKHIKKSVEKVMDDCSITHFKDRLIGSLSGGYQQRVGIAQAVVNNPNFVIFDEPTNGLDPNQITDIRNLIKQIAEDHCVLLSTHILYEVQAICKDIKMIEKGSLVFSGSMDDFNNYIKPESFTIKLTSAPSEEDFKCVFDGYDISRVDKNTFNVRFKDKFDITDYFVKECYKKDWGFQGLTIDRSSVDEVFAKLSNKTEK